MGSWQQTITHYLPNRRHAQNSPSVPIVYSRDFAYADHARIVVEPTRMARADINSASAKTFADRAELFVSMMSHFLGTPARSRMWWSGDAAKGSSMDETKNLRKRLLAGPTVDIFVGPAKRHWSLHRNLLCHHSSYFETEFQGHEAPRKQNADGKDRLELPDDDPRGFELLVKWLYQGQLEDCTEETDEAKYDHAVACHKLYLLSSRFDMICLKNIAMDQYRKCLNESQLVPDADEINDIYRVSPHKSPFRGLMVKIAARQIMDPEIDRDAESYRKCFESNPDFAIEMVNAIRYMSGGILFEDPTEGDQCAYHDHNDAAGCKAQGKGKAKAQQVNGTGPLPAAGVQHYLPLPLVAELSSEKRTPRKLNTPKRLQTTPLAKIVLSKSRVNVHETHPQSPVAARTPVPRSKPAANATPAKLEPSLPHRPGLAAKSISKDDATKPSPGRKRVALQIKPPATNGVIPNAEVESPTLARPLVRRISSITNGVSVYRMGSTSDDADPERPVANLEITLLPNGSSSKAVSGTSNGLFETSIDKSNTSRRRISHQLAPSINDADARSTTSTNESAATSTSRKRKFEDRTPRKSSRTNGPSPNKPHNRPINTNRGPRGANRVNGIARQFDGANTKWESPPAANEGHRRPPPKLRQIGAH